MSVALSDARRIVVKIGSSLLVDPNGAVRAAWLASLAGDLAAISTRGQQVILVSSGAIALGRRLLDLPSGSLRLEEQQAAAAAGQISLAQAWATTLRGAGLQTAQILLTLEDSDNRRRYLNACSTMETLLRLAVVPVVNENDTVATAEIRFGDNDRLSARVAAMVGADLLILLSDVDGLYTHDPREDAQAAHVALVEDITPEIEAMAGGAGTAIGTGGMVSKLAAARIATGAGCHVLVTDGRHDRPLARLSEGGRATGFSARTTPQRARKAWIAGALGCTGSLIVDAGAAEALGNGRSLLPAGVVGVEGAFARGDAVMIKDQRGRILAKGLVAFDLADAKRIAGCRSADLERILGFRGRSEMVHRDNLVLI